MSFEPHTPGLPFPTRQHIGWLSQVYHEVLLLAAQARQMSTCPQMWHQLALHANAVVDRYNTLMLEYFDGFDVWFEDGFEYAWHPDFAQKGAAYVRAVVQKYPLGFLTQLEFELRQARLYMRDHQAESVLVSSSLERFMLLSSSIKRFLDISPEQIPGLLMSDVALTYRYLVMRSLTGGLGGEHLLVAESQRRAQSASSPVEDVTATLEAVHVSGEDDKNSTREQVDVQVSKPAVEDDELDYVLLDAEDTE